MPCKCHATRVEHLDYCIEEFRLSQLWHERHGKEENAQAYRELIDRGLDERLAAAGRD